MGALQLHMYNAAVEVWQRLHTALGTALLLTGTQVGLAGKRIWDGREGGLEGESVHSVPVGTWEFQEQGWGLRV